MEGFEIVQMTLGRAELDGTIFRSTRDELDLEETIVFHGLSCSEMVVPAFIRYISASLNKS